MRTKITKQSKCHTERSRSASFAQAKALVFDFAQTDMLSECNCRFIEV